MVTINKISHSTAEFDTHWKYQPRRKIKILFMTYFKQTKQNLKINLQKLECIAS